MSVEKVSYSSLPRQVYFQDKTKSQQSAQTSPIAKNTDKNSSNVKTIGAIAAGLAVIAAAGIAIASRGRIKSKPVIETAENAAENIKNLSLDAFKEAGNKFVKGKAITKTGEGFTGVLEQSSKNGRTYVKKYENGLLSEVKILEGEKEVSSRVFEYNTEGVVNKVTDGQGKLLYKMSVKDGTEIIETPRFPQISKRFDPKTGKISRLAIMERGYLAPRVKEFHYRPDGSLKYTKTNKSGSTLTSYLPDGKTPEFTYVAGGDAVFYDKNGKISRQITIHNSDYFYDKTNGINFREILNPNGLRDTTIRIYPCNANGKTGRSTHRVEQSSFCHPTTGKKHKSLCISCTNGEKILNVCFEHGNPTDVFYSNGMGQFNRGNNPELYDKIVNNAKEIFADVMKKYRESKGYINKVQSAEREVRTAL